MAFTRGWFFVFLVVSLILYYCAKSFQKYILLFFGLYFYFRISSMDIDKLLFIILYIGLITYIGAVLIDKFQGRTKNFILSICIIGISVSLILFKYSYNILTSFSRLINLNADFSFLEFVAVIGLSYYSLSAIGYLIDVYWGNNKAEKNIVDVFLFIFYFPQIISGPITRFNEMHTQFNEKKSICYENITLGMRRMAFGYFKKLVISERFGVIVTTVYSDYTKYSMFEIVLATLCYAVQLYTDFSGCMDIIMGVSQLFGIELPENFSAPFFSETISEFWRRWHITLGVWFKDYLMYPLQKSKGVQKIGKWSKKKFGKKIGKKVPFYISMLLLWFLIGIWHGGTGYYFIASAMIPCSLLIISDVGEPFFKKLKQKLNINEQKMWWIWFKRIRTLLLVCICWVFVCANESIRAFKVIGHMFTHPIRTSYSMSVLEPFHLSVINILLMVSGLIVLYISDKYVYEGTNIFEVQNKRKFWIRVVFIYLELLAIMLFGELGTSSFIYFKF